MNRHRLAAAIGVVVLFAACTAVPGAKPSATLPPASATPAPSPAPVGCLVLTAEEGHGPKTIAELRQATTDTVIGVFGGFGEPRWNTPDGKRPTPEEFREKPARLRRSVAIELQGEVRGAREHAARAVARGGTLGCDMMTYEGDPELVEGQRYMFFLLELTDSEGKPSGDYLVVEAWPIGNGDVVKTAADGELPLPAAIAAVKNGPKVTPPPSPGEPPETTSGP